MRIGGDVGRVSDLGNVQQQENNQPVRGIQGGGEPPRGLTKGQKFKDQMKNDLGWIPRVLTDPFRGVNNLSKSYEKGKALLAKKEEKLGEIRGRIDDLKAQRDQKITEIHAKVEELLSSDSAIALFDEDKDKIRDFYRTLVEDPKKDRESHTLTRLKKDNPEIGREIKKLLDDIHGLTNGINPKIAKAEAEEAKLEKLTQSKLNGKVARAGLLAIASPFISTFAGVMMAPLLPLFGGMALIRSGIYAGTGHIVGGGHGNIRGELQERVNQAE